MLLPIAGMGYRYGVPIAANALRETMLAILRLGHKRLSDKWHLPCMARASRHAAASVAVCGVYSQSNGFVCA